MESENNLDKVKINNEKYLTFSIDKEEYGIEILKVKEIIGITDITKVPGTSQYIKGVINLRGKIIPVIDFRIKAGFKFREYDDKTCIVIVEVKAMLIGIIVDRVNDVVNIKKESLDSIPELGLKIASNYIQAIGKIKDKIIILLNIENILSVDELESVQKVTAN